MATSRVSERPTAVLAARRLSHWFRHQVSPRINLIDPGADPADALGLGSSRAGPGPPRRLPRASRLMSEKDNSTWREQSHMMSWSRVDFLIHRDGTGLRRFLDALKDKPIPWRRLSKEKARAWQAAAFDQAWGALGRRFRQRVAQIRP